jgi:undecaprenyl-diphosphatase
MQAWQVALLGLIEGLTEFLPVSSTGHLILADKFLGLKSDGTFKILIQLGAILAILTVYFAKLWRILVSLPFERRTQMFVLSIVLAFLPAAILGATFHKFIKEVLLESPLVVCISLIVGGVILLIVDKSATEHTYDDIMDIPPLLALKIGACQCVAMIPGVSRSGATIVGAMLMGASKRAAAEFSFFLAMPTMAGAFAYDLYKNYQTLDAAMLQSIALGFAVAFVVGVVVVRYLLDFVSKRGFAPFAWWRIIIGGMGLGALAMLQ